jgi:hypothetical protein
MAMSATPDFLLAGAGQEEQTLKGDRLHFRFREEFRAPAGVRKSPRNDPRVTGRRLWGFRF